MHDIHDLTRFLDAQSGTYNRALAEVRSGRKVSHWMWFVFPQIAGLGNSPMARRYAISGKAEAEAYLTHPILGGRLREITAELRALPKPDAVEVFGSVDAMKLRSSLTLFACVDQDAAGLFRQALDRWFGGQQDEMTIQRL